MLVGRIVNLGEACCNAIDAREEGDQEEQKRKRKALNCSSPCPEQNDK